jgi:hypothetical protein
MLGRTRFLAVLLAVNGLADSFGGTEFVWTVARSPGGSAGPGGGAETATSEEDDGARYGY